ncbi:MAG TPA: CHAD domain-containing protein, partial [Nitrososphaeraceae archaeon]|nr:CHAD domain-containing protein [Nitrososphaeraceae archaeon]
IEHNLPIIVNDSKKIAELHEVRKDCKKLRYLLELLPENNDKDQRSEKDNYVSVLMEKLENVQDSLGLIHDYDMIVAYLKRHKGRGTRSTLLHSLLAKVSRERQNKYEEFVKSVTRDLSSYSNDFFIRTTDVLA